MTSKTLLAGGVGLLIAAGAVAFPMFGETDYSMLLPSDPADMTSQLGSRIDLAKCIEIAQKKTNGRAASADYDLAASPQVARVVTFTAEAQQIVYVDAETGDVQKVGTVPPFELPGDPVTGDPVTTESGLMYYEIVAGDGPQPAAGSEVTVHYSGWLIDGTQFDSSVARGEPATFPLNRVIPGWTEGVGSMKLGGKRKLVIPYELAYGAAGRPGAIPPKAMLIFDVELLEIGSDQ